jgi:hypothetical protein
VGQAGVSNSPDFLDFKQIFLESLEKVELLERHEENLRVLDVSQDVEQPEEKSDRLRKLGAAVSVKVGDSCFVMQPFAPPLGEYYDSVQ